MNIVDARTENDLPIRKTAPKAIIVHGTGSTIEKNIIGYYKKSPEKSCPHFLINEQGIVYQVADPALFVAWHAKITQEQLSLYMRGFGAWSNWVQEPDGSLVHIGQEFVGYRGWRDTWLTQGFPSPIGFVTADKPNFHSIGIEILSLDKPTKRVFNDVQYEALALLVKQLATRFGIEIDRRHVLGHYDINPIARATPHQTGGYDPGTDFDWNHLWDLTRIKP